MSKFYQHLRYLRSIILFCCLLIIAGCSHKSPYHSVPPIFPEELADFRYRVILLGDGGAPQADEPVLETLGEWGKKEPEKTSIIFLGDNMYPEGLTKCKRHEANARLGPQIAVIETSGAHGLFIPGNHDWANGKEAGYSALLAQEKFINDRLGSPANSLNKQETKIIQEVFLPKRGLPGPAKLDLPIDEPIVRIIALDTQWWLHQYKKGLKMPEMVIEELKSLLIIELPVIVVAHHPLETYGRHGGFRDWKAHFFACVDWQKWCWIPTPLVGSLYHFIKWHLCKSDQDINGECNKSMVSHLKEAFSIPNKTPFLIHASGHDHSLQVLKGDHANYLLVSGAASKEKISEVTDGHNTLFAHESTGFMVMDFLMDGKVLLRVVEPGNKGIQFQLWLKQ